MHCGDLDTRVASILPPFNVLHAVGDPAARRPAPVRNPARRDRSATRRPPTRTTRPWRPAPSPMLDAPAACYKTNFWDIARAGLRSVLSGGRPGGVLPPLNLPTSSISACRCRTSSASTWATACWRADQQSMPRHPAPYARSRHRRQRAADLQLQFVGTQPFFTHQELSGPVRLHVAR
ncbi:MAG: hypothetical protein MZV63_21560 [Marinilabiliales bacterium]|nr:hypothetical protein [Marinilabiliales bacterium]